MKIEMIDNIVNYSIRDGRLMGTLRQEGIDTLSKDGYQEIHILKFFIELKEKGVIIDYSGRWTQSNRLCEVHYTIAWEGYNA